MKEKFIFWFEKLTESDKKIHITLFLISILFAFVRFNELPINEWDEARQAVNALRMLRNGNYLNLFYEKSLPDTWNAKPPLLIWAIIGCFKILGENTFALRLPSLLAGILYIQIGYLLFRQFKSIKFSFASILVLFCCKALFAWHICLTADFDSFLILFALISVYTWIVYIKKRKSIFFLLSMLSLGLAFYSKGPAAFVLIPSMVLFHLLSSQYNWVYKNSFTYIGILLFLIVVLSYFILQKLYGIQFSGNLSYIGGNSSVKVLFYNDIISRFFNDNTKESRCYEFIPLVLDSRLNVWNYIFYFSWIFILFNNRKNFKNWFKTIHSSENEFVKFCLIMIVPLSIFLTFSTNANNWYLAPVFIYFIGLGVSGLYELYLINKKWSYLFVFIFIFTSLRHFIYVSFPENSIESEFYNLNKYRLTNAKNIYITNPTQALFAYCTLSNENTYIKKVDQKENLNNGLWIVKEESKIHILK
ncbi:MAG: glycosyltransferase family 39 protein [Cytophagales bacterium]